MNKRLKHFLQELHIIDSFIGLIGVCFILLAALFVQVFQHEAPCPLCLLQRAAFCGIGLALFMNIRYGNRVSHWAIAILSALAGIAVSLRQISLHVNDPNGFGEAILGIHMYSWSFIAFFITILGCALMLILYPEDNDYKSPK